MLTLFTGLVGLAVFAFVVELVRREKLKERFAVFWVATCLLVVPLSLFPAVSDDVAGVFGVKQGVSLALFLAVVFLLVVVLQLSIVVNRLEERVRILAEESALLWQRADGAPTPRSGDAEPLDG